MVTRKIKNLLIKVKRQKQCKDRRKNLTNKDFTIISNNCWGGMIYQKYGLRYNSPTVGLFILGYDFVKLCADWENYFAKELEFIPWEECSYHYALKGVAPYPVGRLGDVEVYFMHYRSEKEAKEKWERRVQRINSKCILFKISQREECSKEDIEQFMSLPIKNKLCFAYDLVPGTIHVPELGKFVGDEYPVVSKYVDDILILNNLVEL